MIVAAADQPCAVHGHHRPTYHYCELHHIIPQAWQVLFTPVGWDPAAWQALDPTVMQKFPNAAKSPDRPGVVLWDARTVPVCRTGHGNIRNYIVTIMHAMDDGRRTTFTQAVPARKIIKEAYDQYDAQAFMFSLAGLARFQAVSGDFVALWGKGEWGEI